MDYRRGDIFFIKNNKTLTGSEMQGSRPAIIVSNDMGNEHSPNVTVVWLTSREKNQLPTHCMIKAQTLSTVLCESVNTVSKERIERYVRSLTDKEMEDIDRCLMVALGLTSYKELVPQEHESEYEDVISPVETLEDLLESCNEMYLSEANDDKAEGIDSVAKMIRGKLRKELAGGN